MTDPVAERTKATRSTWNSASSATVAGLTLSAVMLFIYYGYIMDRVQQAVSGPPINGNRRDTLGVPLGFGVIVFTFVITGIYVRHANGRL